MKLCKINIKKNYFLCDRLARLKMPSLPFSNNKFYFETYKIKTIFFFFNTILLTIIFIIITIKIK